MKQCIVTVGIAASGKTTWANNQVAAFRKEGETWINLNRDDIRARILYRKTGETRFNWHQWDRKWEKNVTKEWKDAMETIADSNFIDGIIISDTNLNPKTRNLIETTFADRGWQVKYQHFEISYEEAVKRDLQRENPVGSSVIAEQIEKYWEQFSQRYQADNTLPMAVIVDIDGTLAHHRGIRNVFDWEMDHWDRPGHFVDEVVKGLKKRGINIIIMSGRDDICKEKTWGWLCESLQFEPDELFMRVTGDTRKDCIVKREIFFRDIANKYHVIGAIDDRPQVVRLWHSLGIRVLACGLQHKEF